MPITITEATIHQLIKTEKTRGEGSVSLKPRHTVLPNDPVLQKLCADLVNVYGQVANSNGTLGIDPDAHKWPGSLKKYLMGDLGFMPFTLTSVGLVAENMKDAFLSNGGLHCFCAIKRTSMIFYWWQCSRLRKERASMLKPWTSRKP